MYYVPIGTSVTRQGDSCNPAAGIALVARWRRGYLSDAMKKLMAAELSRTNSGAVHPTISRQVTAALDRANNIADLQSVYEDNEYTISYISLSTAWNQVGKLCTKRGGAVNPLDAPGPGKRRERSVDPLAVAFAREKLLPRTREVVRELDMRGVSAALWGVGKLRFKLAEEEGGPYLAELFEARIVKLLDTVGFGNVAHGAQLWLGLGMCEYLWSDRLLRRVVEATLEAMETWELRGVAQAASHMAELAHRLSLTAEQRQKLTNELESRLGSVPRADDYHMQSISCILLAAHRLEIPLSLLTLARTVQTYVSVPPDVAVRLTTSSMAADLPYFNRLGYALSGHEAAGLFRVLESTNDTWKSQDVIPTAEALVLADGFRPPPYFRQLVARELVRQPQDNWLRAAAQAWAISVPTPGAAASTSTPPPDAAPRGGNGGAAPARPRRPKAEAGQEKRQRRR
ncbi:hypothetical protein HYH03_003423 [Edaphochlamys debaryana]|uniref:Uncharacterized protein n=1 Tax=Edaphochlamys debaryana TaxID=47281 RepID=A0A835YJ93_9CHLO|nr:hypothetical protein HYH03_003423 [Edaphochlamys debaryana]|eukprot:KAG2498679.1 hypothetical protein HYH03_003423 [Edaphochlamys debaryana]